MIVLDVEQGSDEWKRARLGIPTASNFHKIVTPTGKLSTQRFGYMHELLAEWALGPDSEPAFDTYWLERGRQLEPEARSYYAMMRDMEPIRVGFIYRDESRTVGCSPDWLCGGDGMAEVKCPAPKTHVGYLLAGEAEYIPQVQGQLWVTGRAWSDFVSYCPNLPPLVVRCEPDAKMMAAFDEHIQDFIEALEAARQVLIGLGVTAFHTSPERQTELNRDAAAKLSEMFANQGAE